MLKLHPEVRLRREDWGVVFYRRDRIIEGDVAAIHPTLAHLVVCNDIGDLEGAALRAGLAEAEVREHMDKFVARHRSCFVSGDTVSPYIEALTPTDWLYEPVPLPLVRRATWPIGLTVLVTDECTSRCCFCCIKTRPPGQGARIDSAVFEAVVSQAAKRGTQFVLLHGGEPMLHPDIVSLVGHVTGNGMHVSFSTKARVSADTANRLAANGLRNVQVSINSPDRERERQLSGTDIHVLLETVRNLSAAGVAVRVNTVVTETTVDELDALVDACATAGVRELSLSIYSYSEHKHDTRFLRPADELKSILESVTRLNSEELAISFSIPSEGDMLGSCQGCNSLRMTAVINPAGQLTLCDKLSHDSEQQLGDLVSGWNSARAQDIAFPSRELFRGTACEQCGKFDECTARGRCMYRCLSLHGKLFAPDMLLPVCEQGGVVRESDQHPGHGLPV